MCSSDLVESRGISVVNTVIILEGIFGFSIRFISVLIVSVPRNSLSTKKVVIYGAFATASETLSNPATKAFWGTAISRDLSALQTLRATKSLQHIKHSGIYLSFKISVFSALWLP